MTIIDTANAVLRQKGYLMNLLSHIRNRNSIQPLHVAYAATNCAIAGIVGFPFGWRVAYGYNSTIANGGERFQGLTPLTKSHFGLCFAIIVSGALSLWYISSVIGYKNQLTERQVRYLHSGLTLAYVGAVSAVAVAMGCLFPIKNLCLLTGFLLFAGHTMMLSENPDEVLKTNYLPTRSIKDEIYAHEAEIYSRIFDLKK